MAENKTQATAASADAYIDPLEPAARRDDARATCALLADATGEKPVMWGPSIIGFGRYRYRYESGREGEMCRVGFSPRAKELVFYGLLSAPGNDALLAKLGKHKTGKGCLYVKRLSDVDAEVLGKMARAGFQMRKADEV